MGWQKECGEEQHTTERNFLDKVMCLHPDTALWLVFQPLADPSVAQAELAARTLQGRRLNRVNSLDIELPLQILTAGPAVEIEFKRRKLKQKCTAWYNVSIPSGCRGRIFMYDYLVYSL